MSQELFNVILGTAGAAGGWILHILWASVRDLQEGDRRLVDKVAAIEVLVAGQYVKKDELDALFKKLDRIEDKIDGKADKK